MSGRCTSSTRHAGTSGFGYARYSVADPNVTTRKSKVCSNSASASQTCRSSSTMNTRCSSASTVERMRYSPREVHCPLGRTGGCDGASGRRRPAVCPFEPAARQATNASGRRDRARAGHRPVPRGRAVWRYSVRRGSFLRRGLHDGDVRDRFDHRGPPVRPVLDSPVARHSRDRKRLPLHRVSDRARTCSHFRACWPHTACSAACRRPRSCISCGTAGSRCSSSSMPW